MGRLKHNDLLDVCLKIIEDNPNEINHTHIKSLFLDLFGAGTDTTSNTLEWAMVEVLRNPDTMTRAKEELEEVIEWIHHPKGHTSAWAIGRDPTVWDDSLEFKPQRFLKSGFDFRGKDFDLIPFGAGRRMCPGLPLAIRMIPIMLGSLVNNFDWIPDTKIQADTLDMNEKFGITLSKANPLCVVPIPSYFNLMISITISVAH
ncbi:putative geraniol 8-hydroxylase [Helianthus debilis subsp. tardiflorus]